MFGSTESRLTITVAARFIGWGETLWSRNSCLEMNKVRILLIGAAGRMGQTIIDVAGRDPGLEIAAQCDQGDAFEPAMEKSDVVIDFSHFSAIDEVLRVATHHRKPLVIGTTGHSEDQHVAIRKA